MSSSSSNTVMGIIITIIILISVVKQHGLLQEQNSRVLLIILVAGHFVGLAGTAAKTGITVSAFELHAVFTLALLGWFFLPVYRATGVFTLPEYMFKRFGGTRIRIYLAVMSLMLYVFTKVATCSLLVLTVESMSSLSYRSTYSM